MKVYAISGLGADKRVFKYLNLKGEIVPIDWIERKAGESIADYALRMAESINQEEEFTIMGLSFGGLIATEISKILNPKLTVLISSAETKTDLRSLYRLLGKSKLTRIIPENLFNLPIGIAGFVFGTDNRELLKSILDDLDLKFAKWAVGELLNWGNEERLKNCLNISGTKDKIMPPSKDADTVLIQGGEHFMIVDRAEEVSEIVNTRL
ncbi:MAG: alpha/beta hydrolase [Candidatus Kapabacteria bacterium]|jgi:pimeloyl-ACP methyl ester carboxylesterase|nr:alpha/beta hydrolase [Candidatus Kapabacteria bacterium]